jgi:hypothetical protein
VSTPSRPLCPRCAADPHPRDFADPRRCAFPAGTFDPDNWQCASMAIVRGLEESHGEAVANGYDQRVVIVILPSSAFAVLGVYKHRGRTEAAVVIHGEKPVRPLTLADIDDLERLGPQGAR